MKLIITFRRGPTGIHIHIDDEVSFAWLQLNFQQGFFINKFK